MAPLVGRSPASNERPTCVFHSQVTKYRLKDAAAPSRYVGRYSHEPELAAQIEALKSSQKPLHQKGAVCEFAVLEAMLDRTGSVGDGYVKQWGTGTFRVVGITALQF